MGERPSGKTSSPTSEELPALFWDTLPEDAENNPDYAGIQAILYDDDSTPEEIAENFKNQGNQRLARAKQVGNKLYYNEAISYYTKGIAVKCSNSHMQSVLYSNRSQAHIYLGNWRKALDDSKEAIGLNSSNLKAYYRGSRASMKLREFKVAISLSEKGLERDPENEDLKKIYQDATKLNESLGAEMATQKAKQESLIAQATELTDHMLRRGVRLCQANVAVGNCCPSMDEDDTLHWPVMFVYPETMQQDLIQDVAEIHTLEDHLNEMFAPDAEPIPWDKDNEYRRETIIVYYLANAGKPFTRDEMIEAIAGQFAGDLSSHGPTVYGKDSVNWVEVEEWKTFRDIIEEPGHVVPGIPTFFLLAKDSKYHKLFLSSNQIRFN